MTVREQLDWIVERCHLLQHPFYRAWSEGKLPLEALKLYAREYGAWIAQLPQGWRAVRDEETAHEEREHLELWEAFAQALGTVVKGDAEIPQVQALLRTAWERFARPETALGALYAFEAQQPATARAKLKGLQAFYDLPESARAYFVVHQHNEHEADKLAWQIEALEPAAQERALDACAQTAQALWKALTGIYERSCPC
jgi:pyrroloquinoline-quinone synthase